MASTALLLALTGCDIGGICTLSIEPGVAVEVRDRMTNDVLAPSPRGVVREGTYQDSLRAGGTTTDAPLRVTTLIGADERPGTYVIQLEADGYLPWDTAGIRVTEGDCHVRTARFTAAMELAP